ncbi:MAG TPA: tRNA (adenosine(37)-N6)-threonylcarbamoyltransferase complex ATPase subunit type 1 TsaE [Chitinophagaceae bacterium]|nr:tRNA (adenosine(37)-N6)-threonylcarbamoyltransferase complex ATPase subunit type 1 TsaE [Chitinophagaceae bacterium]
MNVTYTLSEINGIARQLWNEAGSYKVWAFKGEMGAGKTTFIHALCGQVLGVTGAISSPTFAIINEYSSPVTGTIYHMDWYRMKDEEEAVQAGIEDCLYSGKLCLVEWPAKAEGLLPADTLWITIQAIDDKVRQLQTAAHNLTKN